MSLEEKEAHLRQEIIRVTRIVATQGLARSSDGNISARLDGERILVTPSGLYKMSMEPDDLVIVDGEGRLLAAKEGRRATSELKLHLEVYRQRPDVEAVLHAHAPFATALTIVEQPYPTEFLPEVMAALGEVPTAPYARPGTPDLATSIRELLHHHDNILLSHHGTVSVGKTLEQTLIALERLEHAAYTYHLARSLGEPVPLPAQELAELAALNGG